MFETNSSGRSCITQFRDHNWKPFAFVTINQVLYYILLLCLQPHKTRGLVVSCRFISRSCGLCGGGNLLFLCSDILIGEMFRVRSAEIQAVDVYKSQAHERRRLNLRGRAAAQGCARVVVITHSDLLHFILVTKFVTWY